jgi:hypothetical protein
MGPDARVVALGNEASFLRWKLLGSPGAPQPRIGVEIGDTVLVRTLVETTPR